MIVDPMRVARALWLAVEKKSDGSWIVSGGSAPHRVVRLPDALECDCSDTVPADGPCKHRLAVHLTSRLRPEVLAALRALVPATHMVSSRRSRSRARSS